MSKTGSFVMIYDAVNGTPIADGKCEAFFNSCMNDYSRYGFTKFSISNKHIFDYIRSKIQEKNIDTSGFCFYLKDEKGNSTLI